MRFSLLSSIARPALAPIAPRVSFIRAMSNVAQFVAAAQKADPALAGAAKEQAAITKAAAETETLAKDLKSLNDKLTPVTYLVGTAPSTADVSLYCNLHPAMVSAPATQHPEHPAVLRYFLHVQDLAGVQAAQKELPNAFPAVDVDVSSLPAPPRVAPAPKEKKAKKEGKDGAAAPAEGKKEKKDKAADAPAAAAAATTAADGAAPKDGQKKEKKAKKEKAPAAAPAPATGPLPSMIDLRVGKVLDVKRHPDADSLYVESIDVGEAEPRTVCSGLVKYMTEDEIRGATIIVVCNLKPVTMRGVKSFAMLLCASSKDGKEDGGVEFVLPPAGAQAGDRVYFEGEKYENAAPEGVLNPKKKVFETIQPNFSTLDTLEAVWTDPETKEVHRIRTKDGVCKAKSFKGASLS